MPQVADHGFGGQAAELLPRDGELWILARGGTQLGLAGLLPSLLRERSRQAPLEYGKRADDDQQQVGPFKHRLPPQSAFVEQSGVNEQLQRQ